MTREIKFRGKDINTGVWRYGLYVYGHGGRACIEDIDDPWLIHAVDENTVSEFTGCYDKNSVAIYEGDIVRKRVHNGSIAKCPVVFDNGCFNCLWSGPNPWSKYLYSLIDSRIEVIGNIYDNPELVKR